MKSNQDAIVNYYVIYHLERRDRTNDIRKKLRSMQGEGKAQMAGGALNDPEIMEKLIERDNLLRKAIKAFKNDESRMEYDRKLEAAIASGSVNTAAQKEAQDIIEEIKRLFEQTKYSETISKCRMALEDNYRDADVYGYMARSYAYLGRTDDSIRTAEEGIKEYPENLFILSLGARMYSSSGRNDNRTWQLIERMKQLDTTGSSSMIEEAYLYLNKNDVDKAYEIYDKYVSIHPQDNVFRQKAAYDLIGCASALYRSDPEGILEVKALTSKEDYELCLVMAEKAAQIYRDDEIQEFLILTREFGEEEFNEENRGKIRYKKMLVGGIMIYAAACLPVAVYCLITQGIQMALMMILGAAMIWSVWIRQKRKLRDLQRISMRPKWQIYKYEFYGERELEEMGVLSEVEFEQKVMKGAVRTAFEIVGEIFRHL